MKRGYVEQLELRAEQIWWILLPLVMAVVVALLFPWLHERRVKRECADNMRTVGLWLMAFAEDHGGMLPSGTDWAVQMGDYIEDPSLLTCPADRGRPQVRYVINPELGGRNLNRLKNPHEVVLLYEGEPGSIADRHGGGANYLFADRSVHWLKEPPGGKPVFSEY